MVTQKQSIFPWFWAGLLGIAVLALGLRFWGLSRFHTLVFDEVYFPIFARNYLRQIPFFDAHPPLGKYLLAVGIWLGGFNPFGYRWINALTGALIPLVLAGIAYQLSHRRSFALWTGLLATTDGLLLVESRYGLLNVPLLLFGLLGHWFFLLALGSRGGRRWGWLALSGLSIGGAIAVKWNGLGGLLGLYLLWLVGWGCRWLSQFSRFSWATPAKLPLPQLWKFPPWGWGLLLPAIATGVYGLVWLPHLHQNPGAGFWEVQQQMLRYHQQVGSGPNTHPYCSPWFTWPWLWRPMNYFYQRATSLDEPIPIYGPPPPLEATQFIYDVHALGNPPLWWFSTLAIAAMAGFLVWQLWHWLRAGSLSAGEQRPLSESFWVPFYLVINYAANFLPWTIVSRCTFVYHYLPAAAFSWLAIAWLIDRWLQSYRKELRVLALTVLFLILAGWVFWLPIHLGLPLSPAGFQSRMWLRSWI